MNLLKKLTYITILFACGCGQRQDLYKIKTEYSTESYVYHPEASTISFIKGNGIKKTYLTILDLATRKIENYHFSGYSMNGPHDIAYATKQAVVSSYFVEGYVYQNRLLIVDLEKNQIQHDFLLPRECQVRAIHKPEWSDKVLVLLQKEKKVLLKELDLSNLAISDAELIGNFSIQSVLFLEKSPFIVLHVIKEEKRMIIIYDLNAKSTVKSYALEKDPVELRESKSSDHFYGLYQSPGDNKAEILEFSLKDNSYRSLIQLTGEMETMLVFNKMIYVAGKDLDHAQEQKKYWLHPRYLFQIDLVSSTVAKTLAWSQRNGIFLGSNETLEKLYYAVTDNDDPAVWLIDNNEIVLSEVCKNI